MLMEFSPEDAISVQLSNKILFLNLSFIFEKIYFFSFRLSVSKSSSATYCTVLLSLKFPNLLVTDTLTQSSQVRCAKDQ